VARSPRRHYAAPATAHVPRVARCHVDLHQVRLGGPDGPCAATGGLVSLLAADIDKTSVMAGNAERLGPIRTPQQRDFGQLDLD